jgi:hypothetical protein
VTNKDFLFSIWEQLEKKVKRVYIVEDWKETTMVSNPFDVLYWEEVESFLDDISRTIENENKTIEENSGD